MYILESRVENLLRNENFNVYFRLVGCTQYNYNHALIAVLFGLPKGNVSKKFPRA